LLLQKHHPSADAKASSLCKSIIPLLLQKYHPSAAAFYPQAMAGASQAKTRPYCWRRCVLCDL